jgi:pyruvate formate lyase activating enzyme
MITSAREYVPISGRTAALTTAALTAATPAAAALARATPATAPPATIRVTMPTSAATTGTTTPGAIPRSVHDRPATSLAIAGMTRLSTCDWPGKLVATLFLQGCPLECTYCHNPSLLDPRTPGVVEWSEVLALLDRRQGLLDGVVFSGGEPTRQAGLADAMRQVHDLGFGVGLHTAGPYPKRFAEVLPLCDWIGLDIKAPSRLYEAVTGVSSAASKAFECLGMALASGVDLQVRTTVDPMIMSLADVAELTATLVTLGVGEHVIQQVRAEGTRPEFAARLAACRAGTAAEPALTRRE